MQLTMPERPVGTYRRAELRSSSVLYYYFPYKQLQLRLATAAGRPTRVKDELAQTLLDRKLIDRVTYEAYLQQLKDMFPTVEQVRQCDGLYIEQLYAFVCLVRRKVLGIEALEQYQLLRAKEPMHFDPTGGIDQRSIRNKLLQETDSVLLALFDTAYSRLLLRDLEKIPHERIWVLVSKEPGYDLPTRAVMEQLLAGCKQVQYLEAAGENTILPEENACLLAYGEEALLHCRSLRLDSIVTAIPKTHYMQALVNQFGILRPCVVYVPKGLDITPYVPLTDKTSLTYWQLYRLWQDHGMEIYKLSPQQLWQKYGQYFLNIYEYSPQARDTRSDFPIRMPKGMDLEQARQQAISDYMKRLGTVEYKSCCEDGILVHTVKLRNAGAAQVIDGSDLRQAMRQKAPGFLSNFLFFMTPKLGDLYNDLRTDRPYEQADVCSGHLDYMLSRQEKKETFPLFNKQCIAQTQDGSFCFFPFRLGGGSVCINGLTITWTADRVDAEHADDIRVYTPYCSMGDEGADRNSYRKLVGQDRLNLVILQDRICCIRRGDVVQPSAGVVISLPKDHRLTQMLQPLENGYYSVQDLHMTVTLEPPSGLTNQQWEAVRWAYGGGMTLIREGVGICDDDRQEEFFRQEGWLTPLSRQTQESSMHEMVKHPRTALGLTGDGAMVILVYSGRSQYSVGADYREMIRLARKLHPDIRQLMNVDGGGSAVLGLTTHGSFLELSIPAVSENRCVGLVRPVHSLLYVPI